MAQQEEPMDVDSSMCDFDNKENAYQHGNLPSRTPCTEKGYEELDVAELNMKLRYSTTPTGPMSKSYTVDNRPFDKFADNGNMTQSLHAPLPKSEIPKDLPLQILASDHIENRSVLRPLESTVTLDNDIKVTVSTPHETDEYISLPSSSSSLAQTPEATTPTKDIKDEGSPIMRGLKSVLNMFRPSQSPIPADEDAIKSEVLSPPIVNSPHAPDNNQNNQSLLVSTPLAARKTDMLTKRISTNTNKETVVFNEDLEKELLWKDESTILFDDEKVPFHKLFLQNAKTVIAPKNIANSNENLKQADLHTDGIENSLDSTVEFMDTSYADKTLNAGQVESDSEFVDCETTFNKNESLFSAETSLDNIEFLDSTKDIVDKLSAVMADDTVNVSTNTLEASNRSVDISNVSTVTTQAKAENEENNSQENLNIEGHKEDKTLEEVVIPNTNQDDQPSDKVIRPEDQLSCKSENQDLQDTAAAHVSLSLADNINDSLIISHPDKHFKNFNVPEPHVKENKSQLIDNISQVAQLDQDNTIVQDNASITCKDDTGTLVINTLSQIPLIADPRVLLFNISSEMAVEDVQVVIEAGSVSDNDPKLEQTGEPSIDKVENLLNNTKVDPKNTVVSPPEMSENLLADEMSKIAGEPNDLVTATVQQDNKVSLDQDLSVKNTDEVTESPKTEVVHTGDKEFISSHVSDIENVALNNTISTLEETKPLTIDIPQSPRPENYVVPVSDLVIAGTVQESVCEIPQGPTTPNSNVREHVIKTIPGSFLTKLNDSIERRKSIETEIKQDKIETEIKQEMVENEIKQEMVETETKQDKIETEIKQDKFETVIAPSVVAESTQIIDSEIQSIKNDDEILKIRPKNVDDLEPASKNITKTPIDVDISLQEDIHVNLPESKQTELKEIKQNEIKQIAVPIDFVSNSAFGKDLDNSGKSDCHISVSGNDEFCEKDMMAMASVVEEVVTTPLDIERQIKSNQTDDLANNQTCDLTNGSATHIIEQAEVVATTSLEASAINQDCDVSMMNLSPVKESEDQALVIPAPSAEKEEQALVISAIPVEKKEDQPVVLVDNKESEDKVPPVEKKANNYEVIVVSESNSPFVSLTTENEVVTEQPKVEINKKQVDLDNFEEIENPFSTSSDKMKSPPKSPPIASKGYNFNFDEIDDPFATKTKIRLSPSGDNCNSPNQTFSHMDDTLPVEDIPTPKKVNRRTSQPPQRKPVRVNKKLNSTFAGSKTIDTKPKSPSKNDPKVSEKLDMSESNKVEQQNQVIETPHEEIKIRAENEKQSEAALTSSDNINSKSLEQSTYYSAGASSSDIVTKVNFSDIDDPNFNPFATKTKIQKSPPPSLNGTFESAKDVTVPEIDDPDFNPFATKTKIQKSPPPSLNGTFDSSTGISSAAKTISSDANDMIENFQKPLSPIPREVAIKELLNDPNVTCLSKTSTMQSMQTVCSVNTEDQDTIEGPFLDEMELHEDEKMDLDEEHGMFEFGDLPPGNEDNAEGEIFIDAEAFEFLLNQNQTNAIADSGKESLFLKFDPLFAKRASLGLSSRKSMLKKDVTVKTPQQNTPATTLLDGTFEAIPIEKTAQQSITTNTPQKHTPIAKRLLDSTFEAIPTQNSPQQPLIATQQLDSTVDVVPSQTQIHTPLQGIKCPLRGIKTPPHRDLRTPPRDSSFVSVPPFAETSKLNRSADADGSLEASTDELNVTVAKPTMIVSPAFNPVATPRRATTPSRRSFTFTSPAIAVIDRLLSIGANNSGLGHDSMLRSPDNEADQALVHLRELLAEKEMSVQNLRTESKDLRERLGNLESQMKNLESVNQERLKNINALNDKLNETLQENKSMARVVEQYERTIASLITQTEQDKKRHAEERMQLISERDEATSHLSSMEVSFSDLHSKYEKSKQIIFAFKANDEILKKTQKDFEAKLAKMQSNYESLKQHATAKLNHANEELQKINRAHEAEVLKVNAMLKRKEVDVASLEETLAQKIKTNEELAAICDSLLAKIN